MKNIFRHLFAANAFLVEHDSSSFNLSINRSKQRQIGVNPVLFDAIVHQTFDVLPPYTKANKCEKKRKIFCLISFVSSSRADHEDSGHVYAAFRDEMKERVSIDFRGRRKVSAFKESTMNEMRWFDDALK